MVGSHGQEEKSGVEAVQIREMESIFHDFMQTSILNGS